MAILTLRSVKGSPLTNTELDNNFANINSDITVINTGLNATNSNIGVLSNLTTASNSNVVTAINTLVSNIGVISNLTTEDKSNVVSAINNIRSNVGLLTNLITTSKSNVVSAVNEVAAASVSNVGVISNLTTIATSNLVSAINSVNSRINTEVGSIGSLNTFVTSNVVSAINSLSSEYRSNVGVISNLLTTTKANVVNAVNEIVNRLTVIGITTSTIAGVEIFNSTWSANTIAISRGGTGQTTALGAFNAFSPLTTLGDVLYHNGTNNVRLPGSTTAAKRFLTQTGTGSVSAIPAWSTVDNGDIPASLTGKTYNSLTLTASAVGFTVAGGTTSKTLTINNTVALSGTDGSTLNISTGGTLGTAAFTSSSSYALTGGSNATGTWPISISGTAATATTASSVLWTNVSGRPTALSSFSNDTNYITSSGRAYPRRSDGGDLNFFWSGQGGQPPWLWGGSDGVNMYVYNPSNFSVSYAASSGTASSASSAGAVPASGITGQVGMWTSSARPGPYRLYRRDADDAYSVQTYWTGARWRLRGYLANDAFHAETEVGYADSAGYASSAGSAGSVEWTNVNNRPTSLSSFNNGPGYITSSGRAYPRRSDGGDLNFFWSGQSGQPPWLWGGSDGANMYVYNPSNFSVNYASSAGYASVANYANESNNNYFAIRGLSPSISFIDTDQGQTRYIHHNGGSIGFLNVSGNWVLRCDDSTIYGNLNGTASYATSAGNTGSISGAVGGSYQWTGVQNFLGTQNTAFGGQAGVLTAYGNSGGTNAATMSFHRPGVYAINMGLDTDNVFRIGGWSAPANRLQLDMSGNFTAAGNVTAYSDERLKKDWVDLPQDFIERLADIKHGTFTRTDSNERQVGVSAQSLKWLLPEAVSEDADGMLSVAYGNAAMAACVQLARKVVELAEQLKALGAR